MLQRSAVTEAAVRWQHLAAALLAAVLLGAGVGNAQAFDENRYFQQCLRFEAGGDLETAQQACLNALQVRPNFPEAELALARIEIGLGRPASAEQRLRRVRNTITTAEPQVLLAEAALLSDRPGDAEALLQEARSRLKQQGNVELQGRLNFLAGQIMESQGRYAAALDAYADAIAADSLNVAYRLADAELRLRLNDPASAAKQLTAYMTLTGDDRNAKVRSLLGRALWSQGELTAAADNFATAHQLRGARNVSEQAQDLRALALLSYAEGDLSAGGLALRESLKRENFSGLLAGNTLLWLLLLLFLVGLHLVGESRISTSSSLEVVEEAQPWSMGQVYATLFASLLIALLVTVIYGLIRYGNPVALLATGVSGEAKALFLLTTGVMLALLSWRRVQANGFDALETLLGNSRYLLNGIGWGVLFLIVTIAYLHFLPFDGALGRWSLDYLQATPLLVAAALLVPLSEIYFRPFLLTPFVRRYDNLIATAASGVLYALVFGTPIILLLPFGFLLADAYRRRRSGWEPLAAQLTLHLGLLVATAVLPWVRALFF